MLRNKTKKCVLLAFLPNLSNDPRKQIDSDSSSDVASYLTVIIPLLNSSSLLLLLIVSVIVSFLVLAVIFNRQLLKLKSL